MFTPETKAQIIAALAAGVSYIVVLAKIDGAAPRSVTTPTGYEHPVISDEIIYKGEEFYSAQDAALNLVRKWEVAGFQVSEYEQGRGAVEVPTHRIKMLTQGCVTRYFYANVAE